MRVSLQAEFSRAEFAPEQNRRCDPDNSQRNNLLPIHTFNITRFKRGATSLLRANPVPKAEWNQILRRRCQIEI
jgi:hypothetical protein